MRPPSYAFSETGREQRCHAEKHGLMGINRSKYADANRMEREAVMTTIEQDRTEVSAAADRPITALERCDSCGAQSYVRVMLNGSELLFCGHHAKRHEAKLRPLAEVWHDETSRLTNAR